MERVGAVSRERTLEVLKAEVRAWSSLYERITESIIRLQPLEGYATHLS